MTQPRQTFVYFIGVVGGGLIKIGHSKYVGARLEQLAAWSPVPLEILAAAPGNIYNEYGVQEAFIGQLSHKEWFHPSPQLLAVIASVKSTGVLPDHVKGRQPTWSPVRQRGIKNPKPIKARSAESRERARQSILRRRIAPANSHCVERGMSSGG